MGKFNILQKSTFAMAESVSQVYSVGILGRLAAEQTQLTVNFISQFIGYLVN